VHDEVRIPGIIYYSSPSSGGRIVNKLETGLRNLLVIVQKMLLLTRLVTRTKESTQYASLRVEKPEGVAKASIRCESERRQHRPTLIFE